MYFNQSAYYVDENDGQVQVVIFLSNPSSTDLTVEVTDSSSTAMGKKANIPISLAIIPNRWR